MVRVGVGGVTPFQTQLQAFKDLIAVAREELSEDKYAELVDVVELALRKQRAA